MARLTAALYILFLSSVVFPSLIITPPPTVLAGIEQLFGLKDDHVAAISSAMMASYIDETVDPCNDFFKYSCGNWKKFNSAEARASSVSQVMQYYVNRKMLKILKEPQYFENVRDIGQKIKIYFDSCADINALKKRKVAPIKDYLRLLGGCPSLNFSECKVDEVDWLALAAHIKIHNEDYLIGSFVGTDFLDSSRNVVIFGEPYLTFGSPKVYSDVNNQMTMLRELTSLYRQMGGKSKEAIPFIDFEAKLANISTNFVQQKHSSDVYERYKVSELHEKFPNIDWRRYLSIIRGEIVSDSEQVGMIATDYYSNLSKMLGRQSVKDIVNYLMGRFALFVTKHFTVEHFQTDESRWEMHCVEKVTKYFDVPAAYIFGEVFMKKKRRRDGIRMTKTFKADLGKLFSQSKWMDPNTKARALQKLENVKLKALGIESKNYNRTVLSEMYSAITVQEGQYFENSMSALRAYAQREQWAIYSIESFSPTPPPTTVNAQLDMSTNRIFVGAGALIPPFYHLSYTQFQKYSILGFLIAHEITHAFDNFGHKFDHNGELRDWWTDGTLKEFRERLHCLVEYFNDYEKVDAHFSLNENIADNVGISLAFRAYSNWLRNSPDSSRTAELVPQLANRTSEQLFFIAFAQSQCTDDTDTLDDAMDNDRHINNKARVIASLANLPEFSAVFSCPVGAPMNPWKKCVIW